MRNKRQRSRQKKSRASTEIDPGFFLDRSSQFFRATQIVLIHRAAPAVFAKEMGRLNQFFEILDIGFNVPFFL
jgi:hypothetical protein